LARVITFLPIKFVVFPLSKRNFVFNPG